jgi:hypothetical protein
MKSIVIYNPISGHGHLDSWCAIFTKVLLESGWEVLAITPDPARLLVLLEDSDCLNLNRLKAISGNNVDSSANTFASQDKFFLIDFWRKVNATGHAYVFGDGELTKKKPKKFYEKFLAASYLSLHFCRYFLFPLVKTRLKTQNIEDDLLIFPLSNIECEIEDQKFEATIVFHMYLDSLDSLDSKLCTSLPSLKFKWAGIRFASEVDVYPSYYRHPNLKGIAFLDKDIVNSVAKSLSDVQVRYLPDIANLQVPRQMPDIADLIKGNANGRKIVFLGGIVGFRKNLNLWLNLIDRVDPKKWYFVQIGEIDFKNLNAMEFFAVYKNLISPPENLLLIPSYISDESIFNSVISVSDIIFAVYKEFKNSSNMITKASFFHKPILVSNRYLMGRRVDAYKIGASVSEDDLEDVILGLEKLAAINIPAANFDSYNSIFNQEVFAFDFLNFMDELNVS